MGKFRLNIFFIFLIVNMLFTQPGYLYHKTDQVYERKSSNTSIKNSPETFSRLKAKASLVKKFLQVHNYNRNICFLADLNIASGRNRFFVYDLQNDTVLTSGLVAHGSWDNGFQINVRFSNTINSVAAA